MVELMIAVLILGILTAIAVPRINGSAFNAGVNACRKNVDVISSQIELYHLNTSTWPQLNIGELINDLNYFPDGPPQCPFNTPYVLDINNRVAEHQHLDSKEVKVISDRMINRN